MARIAQEKLAQQPQQQQQTEQQPEQTEPEGGKPLTGIALHRQFAGIICRFPNFTLRDSQNRNERSKFPSLLLFIKGE